MRLRLLVNKMPKDLWRAGPTRERGSPSWTGLRGRAWGPASGVSGCLCEDIIPGWPSVLRPPQLGESQGKTRPSLIIAAVKNSVPEPQGPRAAERG